MLYLGQFLRAFWQWDVGFDGISFGSNWNGDVVELDLRTEQIGVEEIHQCQHEKGQSHTAKDFLTGRLASHGRLVENRLGMISIFGLDSTTYHERPVVAAHMNADAVLVLIIPHFIDCEVS